MLYVYSEMTSANRNHNNEHSNRYINHKTLTTI